MAIDTIKSTAVLDGAIATADIADDAVTADKLANAINTSIAVGASALPKAGGTMTGTIADFRSTGIDDNSNALAMTIDANENIGLGSVPATDWHANYSVLQLGGQSGFWTHKAVGTGKALHISHNTEYDTGFKYIASDEASLYMQGDGGKHIFSTAAAGTAGNAISFSEKVRIDTNGLKVASGVNTSTRTFLVDNAHSGGSMYNALGVYVGATDRMVTLSAEYNDSIMAFKTAGAERMRIVATGEAVIGGTSAGSLSGVNAGLTIRTTNTNSGICFQSGGAATDTWQNFATQSARFYIANAHTANGAYLQYNSSSGWTNVSDQRWKTDWTSLEDSSSKITSLNIGKYHMLNDSKETIDGAKWDYGVKAQELFEVIPDAVDVPLDPEDKYGVVPNIVFWHTVKALQEALATIDAMEARITALEDA